MAISAEEISFATDLFSDLGQISTRRMMGGLCLYQAGVIFALIYSDGQIYLKGANGFGDVLEAEGCSRWSYQREGAKPVSMPYWTLPDAALDDPELACDWARRALEHLTEA